MSNQYTLTLKTTLQTGQATSDQAGKSLFLGNSDALVLKIGSDFKAPAKFTAIKFYENKNVYATGTIPFAIIGANWLKLNGATRLTYPFPTPAPPATSVAIAFLEVSDDLATLTVADDYGTPATDQHVWYIVELMDGNGKTWMLDPEIINTGGNDPRRGFATATDGDTSQTLSSTSGSSNTVMTPTIVTRSAAPTQPTA